MTFCFRLALPDICHSYLISCETITGVWLHDYQMVIHINKIHQPSSTLPWHISTNWLQGHFIINLSLWCSTGRIVGTFKCAVARDGGWGLCLFTMSVSCQRHYDGQNCSYCLIAFLLIWVIGPWSSFGGPPSSISTTIPNASNTVDVGTWTKPDKLDSLWHLTIKLSGSRSEIGSDLFIVRPEPRGAYPLLLTT